jgi:hypothetical protein
MKLTKNHLFNASGFLYDDNIMSNMLTKFDILFC